MLLKNLQAKDKTKHLVSTADPDQLGQALELFGILEPTVKEMGIYKFNKVLLDRFFKNLSKYYINIIYFLGSFKGVG